MTLADTFDRADNASSLGAASDGGTWTVESGTTFGILSNQAYIPSTSVGIGAKARRDTLQVDADISWDFALTSAPPGAVFWFAYNPSTDTGYYFQLNDQSFHKWVSGGVTGIGTVYNGGAAVSSGTTVRCTYNHLTGVMELFLNGTSQGTRTDGSPITTSGNSWVGFATGRQYSFSGETFNNFTAAGGPGIPAYHPSRIAVRSRSVARASVI